MNVLTRIRIGLSQAAQCELRDSYAWHQALWGAFPGQPEADRSFLFRMDRKPTLFECLLLSEGEPTPPEWGAWESKRIAEGFLDHSVYGFKLRANPTMRRASDRRRLGIYREDRLREWMHRKADDNGFELADDQLVIGAPVDETFRAKGRRGKHTAVDFSGVLTVRDRDVFKHAFANGIGSAKAFGFGMLMLQPVT